jgi:hypothetical protein
MKAKRLTSYSSHSGTTSKMWILPNGKQVSISTQHYEWAMHNQEFLAQRFGVNLARVQKRGDTAIRMHLLRRGFVRVNYEHKGGRLTIEASHRSWGPTQHRGCRSVIRTNLQDISFVVVRLLNDRRFIVCQNYANITGCSLSSALRKLKLSSRPPRPGAA